MKKISEILGYTPIDIHSHLDHGVFGDYKGGMIPSEQETHIITIDFLRKKYDTVGIGPAAISTYSAAAVAGRAVEENIYLRELSEKVDWIYQWVVVCPDNEETFRQAEKMLKERKVVGIKIHPDCHRYSIMEKGDKLFSFANELGAVVQMHPQDVKRMPELCDKYPNMKLIIAHLRNDDFMEAVSHSKHGNIYVDTSGGASNQNNVIERAVEKIGADHILFGTDTYSAAFQLGRIAWADISDHDKKKILRDNAIKMFPRAFKFMDDSK